MPAARKKVFRATTGLTIDQQLQVASKLQAQGDDVLKTIRQMKKVSKNQKQTTKTNNLKVTVTVGEIARITIVVQFEWLQEHSRLRKLEENCSKELESLLLRMFNEASTAQESKKWRSPDIPIRSNCTNEQDGENNNSPDNDNEDFNSTALNSTSTIFTAELEDLIRTEQLNRVALINQITSEREQRAALKQLLSVLSRDQPSTEKNNQTPEEMEASVRELVYDAVIGRQMIEATLEDEVQSCQKDVDTCYRKVLETLRDNSLNSASIKQQDQEKKIAELVEAAGGNECPDEMLKLEFADEFRMHSAALHEDLDKYEQEFIEMASSCDAAGSIEAATSKRGGWNESDEERFLKVLRSYEKKLGSKKPQLLYDQLTLVLPGVPLLELKQHVKFHQHSRFYHEKCKDRQREFQRKLDQLQSEAAAKFRTAIDQEQEKIRKLQQLSEMKQQCEQRHTQVSQWRVKKEAKERIEKQQRELEQLMENQKQQEEELLWKRKLDQQKEIVDQYKKGKALDKMADENLKLEEEQRHEEERALQSVINAERVQYRHDEFQRKLDDMKLEEIHKEQLEQQRVAKLNELKEKTPYAQIIANIAPDPERTRQETAAFRSNVEAAQEGLPITLCIHSVVEKETGLFPSYGYDSETLFKNARFKLGIALRNAGLNSSEYARQALANVKVCNVGAYRNHVAEPTKLW
ncbi:hypothetical protein P3T76_003870 [Phytophthora citrophthora]|uniref:Uncharacterized protein n=1 Tax=Phytophthora citrophthora TaxID=4793 RepID=A0AAD9LS98_9STRA|nr:hypothetical protein P3T76_003870 [Phytophthora citrophthora]